MVFYPFSHGSKNSIISTHYVFVCLRVILGIKPTVSHMVSKPSTLSYISNPLFTLCFEIGSHYVAPASASSVTGMIGLPHHIQGISTYYYRDFLSPLHLLSNSDQEISSHTSRDQGSLSLLCRRESCFSPGQVDSFMLHVALWLSSLVSWFSQDVCSLPRTCRPQDTNCSFMLSCDH